MAARRVQRKRAKLVKRKRAARKSSTSQFATIKETIQFKDLEAGLSNGLVFNLSQFLRASALAPNFRWYKAAKVEWSIEPLYNLFVDNGATPLDSVPYLYTVMDRTQNQLGFNLHDIQSSGAKPVKLVSKKTYTFTPNWCSPGLTSLITSTGSVVVGGTAQGLKAEYSYLATPDSAIVGPGTETFMVPIDTRGPPPPAGAAMMPISTNSVCYNGMDIWIDQSVSQGNPAIARCTATVTWIFKDPKFNGYVRDPPAPVELKV